MEQADPPEVWARELRRNADTWETAAPGYGDLMIRLGSGEKPVRKQDVMLQDAAELRRRADEIDPPQSKGKRDVGRVHTDTFQSLRDRLAALRAGP